MPNITILVININCFLDTSFYPFTFILNQNHSLYLLSYGVYSDFQLFHFSNTLSQYKHKSFIFSETMPSLAFPSARGNLINILLIYRTVSVFSSLGCPPAQRRGKLFRKNTVSWGIKFNRELIQFSGWFRKHRLF